MLVARSGQQETAATETTVSHTKMFSFRLPIDLIAALKRHAERNDRTMTAELIRAVRRHLANDRD